LAEEIDALTNNRCNGRANRQAIQFRLRIGHERPQLPARTISSDRFVRTDWSLNATPKESFSGSSGFPEVLRRRGSI
jgi:hypothetical protein